MAKLIVNLNDIIAATHKGGRRAWTAGSFARLCVRMEKVEGKSKDEKISIIARILKTRKATIVNRLNKWAKKGIEFKLDTNFTSEPERLTAGTAAAVKAIVAAERRKTAKA